MLTRRIAPLVGALLLLLALLVANILSLQLAGNTHSIEIGFRADRHFVQGFFDQEEDAATLRYRWTRAESALLIDHFVAAPAPRLILNIGGIPAPAETPRLVYVTVDGTPWTTLAILPGARTYTLLLPPATLQDGDLRVEMSSITSRVPPDRRDLGIRLDRATLSWPAGALALPTWQTLLAQWAVVLCVSAIAWRLGFSWHSTLPIVGGLVFLLAAQTGYNPFVAAEWQYRLLLAAVVVLIVIWGSYPLLARLLPSYDSDPQQAQADLRGLLLLTLLALGVRLFFALYPTFDSHDWYIHEERLWDFQFGSILLFDKPAEFSNRIAIVPPAFYLLVAPLTLFTTDTVPTTHGLFSLLDGLSVLLLGIFVRQLGGSNRAAWLALLIMALLPIQFTALWWGFGPQVIGQALFLLLVVFVGHRGGLPLLFWVVAGVLFSVIMLVHNGVALLAGFWLAGYVALTWLFERQQRERWLGWTVIAFGSALVALVMLYSDVVALQLRGVSSNERLAFTEEDIFRVKYTLGSLCSSFRPLIVFPCDQYLAGTNPATVLPQIGITLLSSVLVLAALGWLLYQARGLYRWLILAWLGSATLFFAVDLAFGLQVRYAYFSVPLVCAGLGLLLDRLWIRHRLGWLLALCIVGLVGLAGLTLWYEGVVPALKPSLRALTH